MKSIVKTKDTKGAIGRRAATLRDEVRHLWTRLETSLPSGSQSSLRIGFCSTFPGEGTSSLAANFAIFLGEQTRRAMLVEANLRHPCLADHFGVIRSPGLSEFLDGTAPLDEVVRPDVAPLVTLVPAGEPPADLYSALGHGAITELAEALGKAQDVMVIDVPPLSNAPEAGSILRGLDGVVLIVQAHRTRREAVEKSLATFEELGVPFLGAVLNRMTYDLPAFVEQIL